MARVGRIGGLVLAGWLILVGAAAAADPDAPARLAAQAAGVVGSGEALSLRLRTVQGERELNIGQAYEDGWTLQALTPTKATLAKDGATREVGLNPTGAVAVAAPAVAPSTVRMAGLDEVTIQHYVDQSKVKDPGGLEEATRLLSLAEARRDIAYQGLINDEIMRRRQAFGSLEAGAMSGADMRAFLGDAGYDEMMGYAKRAVDAMHAEAAADLAAHPVSGPTSYYVAPGANPIAASQGIDRRGLWAAGPADAQGGRTYYLIAGTAEAYMANTAEDGGLGLAASRRLAAAPDPAAAAAAMRAAGP